VGGTAAIAGGNASTTTATSEVAVDTGDEEVAGCSCSVPNRQAQPHAFSLFALGAALLLRTRGRRSRPKRGAQHRVA
jgi:MYXO-CTERM domain-containing protein